MVNYLCHFDKICIAFKKSKFVSRWLLFIGFLIISCKFVSDAKKRYTYVFAWVFHRQWDIFVSMCLPKLYQIWVVKAEMKNITYRKMIYIQRNVFKTFISENFKYIYEILYVTFFREMISKSIVIFMKLHTHECGSLKKLLNA